jgi:cyclopropane fatty-acyl-phospholipid synthase-like methyltransferase
VARPTVDYDAAFRDFDSPLQRTLRQEAYGEDIGQHSWALADELRSDLPRLRLSRGRRLLDIGCGACGPLTFLMRQSGCRGTGLDRSAAALSSARALGEKLGLTDSLALERADVDEPLPFEDGSFDAVLAIDMVLHVADRERLFAEAARVSAPAGRFLVTDSAVLAGPISNEETDARSMYGPSRFTAAGTNERALEKTGWSLVETEDRTASVIRAASGRMEAARAHRTELEELEGAEEYERRIRYLATVIELARRPALRRVMYLAERRGRGGAG